MNTELKTLQENYFKLQEEYQEYKLTIDQQHKTTICTLKKDYSSLKKNHSSLEEKYSSLNNHCHYLNEQLEWFKKQLFGKKSEKIIPQESKDQLWLSGFGELSSFTEEKKKKVASHERRQKKPDEGFSLPADLPIENTIIDLPESEKICPKSKKLLVKIGEVVTSKLACRPASFFIKQITRYKYALPNQEGVKIAEKPSSLLPRCLADESLLAEVLVSKFADHTPLYRLEERLQREGISLSRQLLSQWTLKAALALEPLWEAMKKEVLSSKTLFIDETPLSMLAPGKGKTQKTYMWVVANDNYQVYDFKENRQHSHVELLLEDFQGFFHSDKYGAYEKLAQKPGIKWCPCYAHIRRKFIEAESGSPLFRDWMIKALHDLFAMDGIALEKPPDERLLIRQEKEAPLIDAMIARCKLELREGRLLPKSKIREALGYFCGLIPYLKNYTLCPEARLDNNRAERCLRALVIGRKNWLFVGNSRGGRAAAIALSLTQTCRHLKICPKSYLHAVMKQIMDHPYSKLNELLPGKIKISDN